MRVEQQSGYVLHARPYRETSLLLDCISVDHGRVALVARSVRCAKPRFSRAVLQPFVPLELGWVGGGDLATLSAAESAGPALPLTGQALVCAIYINELVLRLLPRHDPLPDFFPCYVGALHGLSDGISHAWTLRRFERDLLACIGYALVLEHDADSGQPLVADAEYAYIPEHGPTLATRDSSVLRVTGRALLGLALDEMPAVADLASLRRLLRALIRHQLGGASLHSWTMGRIAGGTFESQ
ncbi:MAG: DNA repair protein RecO [Tahibacter sp.]